MASTKKIIILLTLLFFCGEVLSQTITRRGRFENKTYFWGFGFGKSILEIDKNFESEFHRYFNFKIEASFLNWPHNIGLSTKSNFHFKVGEGPYSSGFITSIIEMNILYHYYIWVPGIKNTYLGLGSGLGPIFVRKRGKYISEEISQIETQIKLGIPFELRIGSKSEIPKSLSSFYLQSFQT